MSLAKAGTKRTRPKGAPPNPERRHKVSEAAIDSQNLLRQSKTVTGAKTSILGKLTTLDIPKRGL